MLHWRTWSLTMLALLVLQACAAPEPMRADTGNTAGNSTTDTTSDASPKEKSSSQPRARGLTSEEVGALNVATHRNYIARIHAQNRDEEWAARTERAMRKEIPELLENTATFIEVNCRTNACLVLIEWRSFIVAQGNWERLLISPLSVACDREITLPNPENLMQPYRETLVMANCKR